MAVSRLNSPEMMAARTAAGVNEFIHGRAETEKVLRSGVEAGNVLRRIAIEQAHRIVRRPAQSLSRPRLEQPHEDHDRMSP
jgi:hypothetical protein